MSQVADDNKQRWRPSTSYSFVISSGGEVVQGQIGEVINGGEVVGAVGGGGEDVSAQQSDSHDENTPRGEVHLRRNCFLRAALMFEVNSDHDLPIIPTALDSQYDFSLPGGRAREP